MKTRTLAAIASVAALTACSAEFNAVAIQSICAPPAPDSETGSCLYPATCEATLAGTPVLDVSTATLDFRLPFQINNQLLDNSGSTAGGINTNDAYIQSFEMTYAGASLASWTVPAAVTVPAAGSSGALLRLVPFQYFTSILAPGAATTTILVNVRANGVLGSQDSFTSAWFQVPVVVCAGCLAGNVCGAGSTLTASCPSSEPGATSPGQTAAYACTAVAQ